MTERFLGKNKLGTTKRGIGPAYADKALRVGLRVQDLLDPKIFREKLDLALREKNGVLAKVYNRLPLDADEICEQYLGDGAAPRADDRRHRAPRARGARRRPARALRGRAGHLPRPRPRHLSVRHVVEPGRRRRVHRRGRRPARDRPGRRRRQGVRHAASAAGRSRPSCSRATRSATCSSSAAHEFGTNTGRRRRAGWLDLVMLRHAVRLNTCSEIAITKLDVLVAVSTSSRCASPTRATTARATTTCRTTSRCCTRCSPVYETLPGWECDIDGRAQRRRPSRRGARLRALRRGARRACRSASSASAPTATRPSCSPRAA